VGEVAARLGEIELRLVKAAAGWPRYEALLALADALVRSDPRRALLLAREAATLAQELDDAGRSADARVVEAAAQRVTGRPHESLAALDGLVERFQDAPDRTRFARVLLEVGSANLAINLLEYAQEFLEESIAVFAQADDVDGIARSNLALAELWLQSEQWREAVRCFDRAERADHRLADGNRHLAAVYAGRGLAMALQERPVEALVFLDRALDWAPSFDDALSRALALFRKGQCLVATGNETRGGAALREAEVLAGRHGFDLLRIEIVLPLAQLHIGAGDAARAERELREALTTFDTNPFDEREAEVHRVLADACERQGGMAQAAEHHRRCHELNARSLRLASHERRQRLRLALRLRKTEAEKQAAEDLSRLLEQRVAERTGDLTRTVAQLEREVSERERAERQARFLAEHDPLTGLPNRTLLTRRLAEVLAGVRGEQRAAVLFIDLDGFKQINDAYGHAVGDRVLRDVCSRLEGCVQPGDTLGRYGGDEFVLVVRHAARRDGVVGLCRQLIDRFAAPVVVADRPLFLGCAIGVAIAPEHGPDAMTLVQNADAAMHHARAGLGARFAFFEPDMLHPVQRRLALSSALRLALQRREFTLAYQPRIARIGNRVAGVEALLRWHSPELGAVPPGDFIGVAEQSGLIGELGAWVLHEACRQARAWDAKGLPPLPIAVNLSARQLAEGRLVGDLQKATAQVGLPASRLEMEITESLLLQDPDGANEHLAELRRLGVKIALDDFGTGYSNLAYLSRLALDFLKIDRSFVERVDAGASDRAIVSGMIAMARGLGVEVIAEGVETPAQLAALHKLGCDYVQGFHFAPPLPAEQFEQYLLTGCTGAPEPSRRSSRSSRVVPAARARGELVTLVADRLDH
jgi:diguanylate cyclase (GGDEF)-like protein